MRIGQSGGRRYCTNSAVPGSTHKISTDIKPMLPPFFTGEQNVPNFGPNFDPSRLRTAVCLNRGTLPQMVKVHNFLYILHSSGARPAGARQYYTNSGAPAELVKYS